MSKRTYLPNGSVVLLKDSNKRVMIYARRVADKDGNSYDYMACKYPEGAREDEGVIVFNHEDIAMIFFIGFQDIEELAYREVIAKADKEESNEQ